MNEIRNWLRAGDPALHEPAPPDGEMASILRHAARELATTKDSHSPRLFRVRYAAAVAVTTVAVAGAWWNWHSWDSSDAARAEAIASVQAVPARELYFTTPEGVRIIWIFNPSASE